MYYLIGRDLDADGSYEFIQDMDNMILTEDANRALQVTDNELRQIDMAYLNEAGFYALEADRFNVSILEQLLFVPLMMGFRPRIAPPPRRRRRRPAPPRPRRAPRTRAAAFALDVIDILTPMHARPTRHGPKPRPAAPRRPRAAAARPARPAARPAAGPGRAPARPAARPGAGRKAPGRRGPGGRGPGR